LVVSTAHKRSWQLKRIVFPSVDRYSPGVPKFSNTYAPTWAYRFGSTGPAVSGSANQTFFISTAAIAQLIWSPNAPTPLLLTFDTKGVITAASSAPAGQSEVLTVLNSKELGVLALTSGAESVSIFTPNPR